MSPLVLTKLELMCAEASSEVDVKQCSSSREDLVTYLMDKLATTTTRSHYRVVLPKTKVRIVANRTKAVWQQKNVQQQRQYQ